MKYSYSPWPGFWGILAGILLVAACIGISSRLHSHPLPPQAQASTLSVPAPTPYRYQSAIVIQSCSLAIGIIFVDSNGKLYPIPAEDLKKMTLAMVLTLLTQAPADHILSVVVPCVGELKT